jgi:hypothetical protein
MTRPIEAVIADAQRWLERSGRLNVADFTAAYPDYAAELEEILPVMLTLHRERRWQKVEAESRASAIGLFAVLRSQPEGAGETVGSLLVKSREEVGLSLEEQAHHLRLPVGALEQLSLDQTPLKGLDNSTIRNLAARFSASFATLAMELRRLASVQSLSGGPLFTRDRETSSSEEEQALRDKVREAARRSPEKRE